MVIGYTDKLVIVEQSLKTGNHVDFIQDKIAIMESVLQSEIAKREAHEEKIRAISTDIEKLTAELDRWQRIYNDSRQHGCSEDTLRVLEEQMRDARKRVDAEKVRKLELMEQLEKHEERTIKYCQDNLKLYREILLKIQ
jgi:chromosome segregation ATPase